MLDAIKRLFNPYHPYPRPPKRRKRKEPTPPKQYWQHLTAVKYKDIHGHTYRRVMHGSLCKDLNIDLTAFSLDEINEFIHCELFPLLEDNHDLKVHQGMYHVRIWKDPKLSGSENYFVVFDTRVYDRSTFGAPLREDWSETTTKNRGM